MPLPITALTAAICAIMILATAIATVRQRLAGAVAFGDGDNDALIKAMRSHGNLTEHAPVAILMIGMLELVPVNHLALAGVAAVFLGSRVAHIIGMNQVHTPGKAPLFRQLGVIGTWLSYAVLIAWILYALVTLN